MTKTGGWFSLKINIDINWTNGIGAAVMLLSAYKSFAGGAIIGALLMLGRKGIDLANRMIDNKYGA